MKTEKTGLINNMTSSNLSLSWSFFYFNTRNIQASGFPDSGMQEAGTNGSICLLQIHRQNNLSGAGGAQRSHTKGKATRICRQPHIVVLYKKKWSRRREKRWKMREKTQSDLFKRLHWKTDQPEDPVETTPWMRLT